MEEVEVTARFDQEGRITPLQLGWRGRTLPVESTGRRWDAEDGRHILAMIPGERVVELLFIPGEGRWFLRMIGSGNTLA
jgi:hypothetical protein